METNNKNYVYSFSSSWVNGYVYHDGLVQSPRNDVNLGTLSLFGHAHEHVELCRVELCFAKFTIDYQNEARQIGRDNCVSLLIKGDPEDLFNTKKMHPSYSVPPNVTVVGVITASRARMLEFFEKKRISERTIRKTLEILSAEVYTFLDFLHGETYRVEIEDVSGNTLDVCSVINKTNAERECRDLVHYYVKEYSNHKKDAQMKRI